MQSDVTVKVRHKCTLTFSTHTLRRDNSLVFNTMLSANPTHSTRQNSRNVGPSADATGPSSLYAECQEGDGYLEPTAAGKAKATKAIKETDKLNEILKQHLKEKMDQLPDANHVDRCAPC